MTLGHVLPVLLDFATNDEAGEPECGKALKEGGKYFVQACELPSLFSFPFLLPCPCLFGFHSFWFRACRVWNWRCRSRGASSSPAWRRWYAYLSINSSYSRPTIFSGHIVTLMSSFRLAIPRVLVHTYLLTATGAPARRLIIFPLFRCTCVFPSFLSDLTLRE
jgi:hypothetical protein